MNKLCEFLGYSYAYSTQINSLNEYEIAAKYGFHFKRKVNIRIYREFSSLASRKYDLVYLWHYDLLTYGP